MAHASSKPTTSATRRIDPHTVSVTATAAPPHLLAVLFRGRPCSYAGVPLERFLAQPTFTLRRLRDPTTVPATTISDADLNTQYSVFYALTFHMDRRQVVKIGVAEQGIRRMKDYLYTYGHICPRAHLPAKTPLLLRRGRVVRRQAAADVRSEYDECNPPNAATGVFVHMMLLSRKPQHGPHVSDYYPRAGMAVRRLEDALKAEFKYRRPSPPRGTERFVVTIGPFLQHVLRRAQALPEAVPVRRRLSMRRSASLNSASSSTTRSHPTPTSTNRQPARTIQRTTSLTLPRSIHTTRSHPTPTSTNRQPARTIQRTTSLTLPRSIHTTRTIRATRSEEEERTPRRALGSGRGSGSTPETKFTSQR